MSKKVAAMGSTPIWMLFLNRAGIDIIDIGWKYE